MEVFKSSFWERFAWRHPEWWTIALSVIAWLLLCAGPNSSHLHYDPALMSTTAISGRTWLGTMELSRWLLMAIAMMLPLVVDSIRGVADRSMWARRHRAVFGFVLGYLSVWLVAGVVVSLVAAEIHLDHRVGGVPAAIAAFAIAALWQLTPAKRWAIRACHKTLPIAPCAWRADRDCYRYGLMIGASCLVSCWALMAACSIAGHSIAAMTVAASAGVGERYLLRPGRTLLRVTDCNCEKGLVAVQDYFKTTLRRCV